jgi:hypothetical protein
MIDNEAKTQLDRLAPGTRPVIISDIDEVILNFVLPFRHYLASQGYQLQTDTYKLNGNVFNNATGVAADNDTVFEMISGFFDDQAEWQDLVDNALPMLSALSNDYDIVLLTAMPHAHRDIRTEFMRKLGVPWPILTVESDKGHSVAVIAGERSAVFIDDMAQNHDSVAEHAPDVHLFQFMAYRGFTGEMPTPPAKTEYHVDWTIMADAIRAKLG